MGRLVVHCKREAYDVYIGRGSRWGNPFSHRTGTKALHVVGSVQEAIAAYRRELWLLIRLGEVSLAELAALDGQVLGCYCAPGPCHGDVLQAAAAWAAGHLCEQESLL